jgi:hypothetical protein
VRNITGASLNSRRRLWTSNPFRSGSPTSRISSAHGASRCAASAASPVAIQTVEAVGAQRAAQRVGDAGFDFDDQDARPCGHRDRIMSR